MIIEYPPLCNGETLEYQTHLKSLVNLRMQTLFFITNQLGLTDKPVVSFLFCLFFF